MSDPLSDAVLAQVQPEELARCPVPESFLAACLHREDEDLFAADEESDVRIAEHLTGRVQRAKAMRPRLVLVHADVLAHVDADTRRIRVIGEVGAVVRPPARVA